MISFVKRLINNANEIIAIETYPIELSPINAISNI